MKKILIYLLTILPALMGTSACSTMEDDNFLNSFNENSTRASNEEQNNVDFFSTTVQTRTDIAKWFAKNYTLNEAKRIHKAVSTACLSGLDEVYYLKEYAALTSASNKVALEEPTQTSMMFRQDFSEHNEETASVAASNTSSTITFNHERLQLYWPYSEDWDGKTTPVVAYAPKSLSTLNTEGFIYVNGNFKTVTVDEAYCMTHPVWIITESETPYSLLPNLAHGEVVSPDGTLYSTNIDTTVASPTVVISPDSLICSESGIITTMYLGYVRAEKQHDSLFAGGSEFMFKIAYLKNGTLTCEADTSKCIPDLSKTKISFTRKDIRKKRQKDLKSIAVSSWPKNIENIVMTLIEEDGGSEKEKFESSITLTWRDKKYGIDVSIPYCYLDDFLGSRTYAREFVVSSNNYEGKDEDGNDKWAEDNTMGVYWTIPYKIGFSYEYGRPQ